MSEEEFEPLSEAEERRITALLRGAPRPVADPAFRARARHQFLSGRPPAESHALHHPPPAPRWRIPPSLWAAAAAVIVLVSALVANRGPEWEVTEVQGEGIAIVNQMPVPLGHVAELSAAIRPGARVRVPEGTQVEIAARGALLIQLLGGSDMIVPGSPGRWIGRNLTADLSQGEMRIHTGEGFEGARLRVRTREADVTVTGTTLAVICEPLGTCVCVLEGAVRVDDRQGQPAEVPAGKRRFVFSDGRSPENDDMLRIEREELGLLLDRDP